MELSILLVSFALLLAGVFIFKKLWLGALTALLFFISAKALLLAHFDFILVPLGSGIVISFELILLLFGAYLFYNILNTNNQFEAFMKLTSSFSSKIFIILLLCLFMSSFMEGIAGFGIPAMLVAPLLFTMGFKPLTSIILPLAGNTTAVTFGALGTPLKVGLGIYESESTVLFTLIINCLPALLLPFFLAFLYHKTERVRLQWRKEWKMLLGAGLVFTIPYFITGLWSIEYPSVVAGFVGLIIFGYFFIPKSEKPSLVFWLKTFHPYLLFVLLLLIAKYFLSGIHFQLHESIRPLALYQPGAVFIITGFIYLLFRRKGQIIFQFFHQSKDTISRTGKSIITITLLTCFARFIKSDLATLTQIFYSGLQLTTKIFINPLLGITGSFISGSATMSNLMLSHAIRTDEIVGVYLPLLLALLHTGSSIGNAISLQNIIMVKSVIDQSQIGYSKILKYNIILVAIYALIIIGISLMIVLFGLNKLLE